MNEVTIGSLFSGAGGLCELALAPLLGGRVAWHCEYEPPSKKTPKPTQAAARVLAHRFPGTPNLGDITRVDWSTVPPVRVMTGGFPCTDVSLAGAQAGLTPETRSGTWTYMAHAIDVLRPELVVIENVRGLASSPAHSDLEPCPWCLGDGPDQHALRALGAVLGDLADRGYDAVWCGLRASDLGACHARFRFVILAAPADTGRLPGQPGWLPAPGQATGGWSLGVPSGRDQAGTGQLLPTPRATDGTHGGPNQRGSSGDLMLPSAVAQLLPTPTAVDARGARNATSGRKAGSAHHSGTTLTDAVWLLPSDVDWGVYEAAVSRHEQWLRRPRPFPWVPGATGKRKLNPQLSEWMMGWPAGWVTDVPGLTLNEQLQVCGNGVVPQQMATGVEFLLPILFNQLALGGAA